MEENYVSEVYILLNENNRIIACEGGYTMSNIKNIEDWIKIDEGEGDKYNLCQSHYFDLPLMNDEGCHNYIYENGAYRETTAEEKEAEIKPQEATITLEERINDLEMAVCEIVDILSE